jgi:ParB-like chromosome segregation protein Spo0J
MAAKKIKIEHWPISKIEPYTQNARTHSHDQIRTIANSMRQFGFVNPVLVDSANVLIAGHGRLEAAKTLGITEIPVIQLHGLTEAEVMALRIADNSIALNSGWDAELLQAELGQLEEMNFDLAPLGLDNITLPALDDAEPVAPRSTKTKTTLFISVKNADAAKAKSIISAALKKAKIEANI